MSSYLNLCISLQAIRRTFEEVRTPIASALGVGASFHTHQIANVLRVLTDIRIRHLLADEVGLGKTVQALMIVNALRRQRSDLRVLVIVPSILMTQWRDEFLSRGHTAPYETEQPPEDEQYVRLVWDGNPHFSPNQINPQHYQLLIVDELHRLTADYQNRIVRAARDFEHLLILTATPSFQQPERHLQMLSLLEPERTTLAQRIVEQILVGAEGNANQLRAINTIDLLLQNENIALNVNIQVSKSTIALGNCIYRRLIRTRRLDYRGFFPLRTHIPLIVEPLANEVKRQALMWDYFKYLPDGINRILLAKRVILSPVSLNQRVRELLGQNYDTNNILSDVRELSHHNMGDSRLDALIDLLADIWTKTPDERVLVAAQDTPTVDYLFDAVKSRLPEIGPLDSRTRLEAVRIRQGANVPVPQDIAGNGNEYIENLESFQRGSAQLLIAPEIAQVGLNLQCARIIVLYSIPWTPAEVEQWIGRLDRIGNVAVFASDGTAKDICIYTIAQRGLADEQLVTSLQHFHVFERSQNLGVEHQHEIAQALNQNLAQFNINLHGLENTTEQLDNRDQEPEIDSPLRQYLPYNVEWARLQRQKIDALSPAPPDLRQYPLKVSTGPKSWDRAFEPMLKLLRIRDYYIQTNVDPVTENEFRTIWYQYGFDRQPLASIIFSVGEDPYHARHPRNAHAFVTRREDLQSFPLRSVTLQLENEQVLKPLRFLSYGDMLHDELISGWAGARQQFKCHTISFPEDHCIWAQTSPGFFFIHCAVLDAGTMIDIQSLKIDTMLSLRNATGHLLTPEQLVQLEPSFNRLIICALESDVRWLRHELSAIFNLVGKRSFNAEGRAVQVETLLPETLSLLVNPVAADQTNATNAGLLELTPDQQLTYANYGNQLFTADLAGMRFDANDLSSFNTVLETRIYVIAQEATAAIRLAENDVSQAKRMLDYAVTQGHRAQITLRTREHVEANANLLMTTAYWQSRSQWLSNCRDLVENLVPSEKLLTMIRADKQ